MVAKFVLPRIMPGILTYGSPEGVIEEFARRLRSGDYEKVSGYLRFGPPGFEKFCATGVLCDIVDPTGWTQPIMNDLDRQYLDLSHPPTVFYQAPPNINWYHHGSQTLPSVYVRTAAGLWQTAWTTMLMNMNDGTWNRPQSSFEEIADMVEKRILPTVHPA